LDETSIDWESKFFQLINDLTALLRALDSAETEMTIHDVKTWLMTLLSNAKPFLTTHLLHKDTREKANQSAKIAQQQLDRHLPDFLGNHLPLGEGATTQELCQELETIHQESYVVGRNNSIKSQTTTATHPEDHQSTVPSPTKNPPKSNESNLSAWNGKEACNSKVAESTAVPKMDETTGKPARTFSSGVGGFSFGSTSAPIQAGGFSAGASTSASVRASSFSFNYPSSSNINTNDANTNSSNKTSDQAIPTPVGRQHDGKENNKISYEDAPTPVASNLKPHWDRFRNGSYASSYHGYDYSANPHAGTYSPNSPVATPYVEKKRSVTEFGFPPQDFPSAAQVPTPDVATSPPFSSPPAKSCGIASGRYGLFS
jgi:hypothetical protein